MTSPRSSPSTEVRHDLPWLRRRTLRTRGAGDAAATGAPATAASATAASATPVPSATAAPATPVTSSLDLRSSGAGPTSPGLGSSGAGPTSPGRSSSGSTSLDLGSPGGGSTSLDLGSAGAGSTSLDLGSPGAGSASPDRGAGAARSATPSRTTASTSAPGPSAPAGPATAPAARPTTSLDLAASSPSSCAPAPARRSRPEPPSAAAGDLVLAFTPPRVHAGSPVVLTPAEPVVALTALQSGVGALTVEAACSDAVGDLRLACAYRLAGARPSLVAHSREVPVAGLHTRRPVIVSSRERFEQLVVDLRQVRAVERLVVLAYSESGAALDWGGTLVVHGFGGLRVEAPLRHGRSAGVLVALSVLRVGGELVLRAEDELIEGTLRDACTAHGFEQITWVDTRTPLV